MDYVLLKWMHIISSTILFGTGIGCAFFMFMANRRQEIAGIYFASRHVVIADWLFTTPSILLQLWTGMLLSREASLPLNEGWVLGALILYVFMTACWLPMVWLQIKMRNTAKHALETAGPLPTHYWKYDRIWATLRILALLAVMLVFWLMVNKPAELV